MFTKNDLNQLQTKGISPEKVLQQIENFKNDFAPANITKAATIKDGIVKLTDAELNNYAKKYDSVSENEKIVKFVPASGAASRMFKALFTFMNKYDGNNFFFIDKSFNSLYNFFENINTFAFYDELKEKLAHFEPGHPDNLVKTIEALLLENGMNYGQMPKGLLKFHKYGKETRTAAQEHLAEGAMYAKSGNQVSIHFTVSPEHRTDFETHIKQAIPKFEKLFNVKYNISFSEQKPETDTIAVDLECNPFRNNDNSLHFRPAGHGALIENLQDIEGDLIFIKNIDNVVPDKHKAQTVLYKKALAGILLENRNQIFEYIKKLNQNLTQELTEEIKEYLQKKLSVKTDNSYPNKTLEEKQTYLLRKLNRPIRVCGMVKNEGEPGGGPFFVQRNTGSVSLQIIEGAQIDLTNPEKQKIVESATHFNPVDLICSIKKTEGGKYNLSKYIDFETGFISLKTKDGQALKAQELPGLWNGAMANWNTIFVEVPIETFNPVKTVNDLLRPMHT